MEISALRKQYATRPQLKALAKVVDDSRREQILLDGLLASAAPLVFSSLAEHCQPTILFILQDAEEAGYFYHDLTQLMGTDRVLFFPSSYRRSVKYAQRDPANEILRTEVLASISSASGGLYIVAYPEAVAEMVVTKKQLDSRTLTLTAGQTIATAAIEQTLQEFGFHEVDYVYEPGQYALRGSILDVFSFSSEFPFRVDFFGDEIDSIRTFEVEDQLSKDRRERIDIVPELAGLAEDKESLLRFLPADTLLCVKDMGYVADAIDNVPGKLQLIQSARAAGVPIICAMGAGNKLDPTRFEVADIYDTSVCPLARVVRQRCRKLGIEGVKVVYSREEPIAPAENQPGPGSTAFVPAVAGLIMAGEIVRDLIRG